MYVGNSMRSCGSVLIGTPCPSSENIKLTAEINQLKLEIERMQEVNEALMLENRRLASGKESDSLEISSAPGVKRAKHMVVKLL